MQLKVCYRSIGIPQITVVWIDTDSDKSPTNNMCIHLPPSTTLLLGVGALSPKIQAHLVSNEICLSETNTPGSTLSKGQENVRIQETPALGHLLRTNQNQKIKE